MSESEAAACLVRFCLENRERALFSTLKESIETLLAFSRFALFGLRVVHRNSHGDGPWRRMALRARDAERRVMCTGVQIGIIRRILYIIPLYGQIILKIDY